MNEQQQQRLSIPSLPDRKSVRGNREGDLSGMAGKKGSMHEARTSSSLRANGERRRAHQERCAEQTGAHFSQSPPNELEVRATFTAPIGMKLRKGRQEKAHVT